MQKRARDMEAHQGGRTPLNEWMKGPGHLGDVGWETEAE